MATIEELKLLPEIEVPTREWLYEGPLYAQYVLRHVAQALQGVDHTEKQERDFYEAMRNLLRLSEAIQVATATIERAVNEDPPL